MCSLQVRDEQGKWAFVRHTPGAIIVSSHPSPLSHCPILTGASQVNCGVFMEWYTGGYFKAANHRVAAPPDDQRNHTRMGVFYFAVPNDDDKASNRGVVAS
jgi:isopenicillin N synthase-like dioxygenase